MDTTAPTARFSDEMDRVRQHTAPDVQRRIDEKIETSIRLYANQPRDLLDRRIRELEEEIDVERVLETNASSLALAGVLLGTVVTRKWLFLSAGVLGFLLMHAVKGWCPPLPALRRMGVRTQKEIDREMYALKALRGDFDAIRSAPRGNGYAAQPAIADQ